MAAYAGKISISKSMVNMRIHVYAHNMVTAVTLVALYSIAGRTAPILTYIAGETWTCNHLNTSGEYYAEDKYIHKDKCSFCFYKKHLNKSVQIHMGTHSQLCH